MNSETTENITNMDAFLEKEKQMQSSIPWAKLDKTAKIRKINSYVDSYTKDNKLTSADNKNMKNYLRDCLDKKMLSRVKDVTYDKKTGEITSIPAISFNRTTRKFTLKRADKRAGTSKCLAPRKPRKTRKVDSKLPKEPNEIKDKN